jgi:dTDP-4-dehydrorhamnose 3,5-epimerase-like enzyme
VSLHPLRTLSDVTLMPFRGMAAEDRLIVPIEAEKETPFPIRRVFTIKAGRKGLIGGRHAHRECSQLIIVLHGVCEVACIADNPDEVRTFRLDRPDQGVLVPPSIWAEQRYLTDEVVLMVLCDRGYEAADYIRDFDAFLAFRRGGVAVA